MRRKKPAAPKRRNPAAAALGRGLFRNRTITPKVVYKRNRKHKGDTHEQH